MRSAAFTPLQRSLYEVGLLWERGQVSVATEHLSTAITESLLNLAYPRLFRQPHTGKSAGVACVANEYHQIGGKMVADLFELHGWRGYFLGANTPLRDLLRKPVGIIMTYGEFVLDEAGDRLAPEQREFLRACLDAAAGMKRLIDDFLDVAMIESGKLRLDLVPTRAEDIVSAAAARRSSPPGH